MNERSPAVFLSYASQDTDAARKICEALQSAGVEVWFDQSELRGGDAWDSKIRRQIKECALFVPVISTHTQSRPEGYFRLEWKLAVDRSHLMADDQPFIVPVVIDDTPQIGARVPEKFQEVQWTRLALTETPAAFAQRVSLLLTGGGRPIAPFAPVDEPRRHDGRKSGWRWWMIFPIAGMLFALVPMTRPLWNSARGRSSASSANLVEARQLAERARQHYQGIFTRADLAQAEELGRRAAELDPTLALGWAVRAGANACYLLRGFVTGDAAQQRARDAQTFAARAIAIQRDETEALIALGELSMYQDSSSQAEGYYRRVLAKEPNNAFAARFLSIVLRKAGRTAEAVALMKETVKRHPKDALCHFDLALAYAYGWNWPRAWEAADASLAVDPFPGALMLKVRLAFQWKGDVALMRRLLDQVDLTYRTEDEAVVWEMRCGLFERNPERVLEAAGRTSRTYLEETFIFPAPKAWYTALALRIAGKPALAQQHWRVAETTVQERINVDPQNLDLRLKHAVILAWMKSDKARAELAAIESAWRDQLNPDRAWDLASFYAAAGDAATAVPLLRQALHAGTGIAPLTVNQLKLDPWWDEIRGSPEFAALLENAPPLPAPVADE